jgi:hypothetical protein
MQVHGPNGSGLDGAIAALKPKVIDRFSRCTIEGAQHALADLQNPLRLNFFSTVMRILFEHILDALSPEDQVANRPSDREAVRSDHLGKGQPFQDLGLHAANGARREWLHFFTLCRFEATTSGTEKSGFRGAEGQTFDKRRLP